MTAAEYFHDGMFLGLEFLTEKFASPNDLRVVLLDSANIKHEILCYGCVGIRLVNFERPSFISVAEISNYEKEYDLADEAMITRKVFAKLVSKEEKLGVFEIQTHVEAELSVVCKKVQITSKDSLGEDVEYSW